MTFLELCQRLRQEVGAAGNGPQSVQLNGCGGEYARLIEWIKRAWHEIQTEQPRWRFAWAQGGFDVQPEFRNYEIPDDVREWAPKTLQCNGVPLTQVSWPDFRERYSEDTGNPRPRYITLRPDGMLLMDTTPDAHGRVTYEYWRTPQELIENTDVPRMSERFHMAIVYRAMRYYGYYENAPEVIQAADRGEARVFVEMVNDEMPCMETGEPLA